MLREKNPVPGDDDIQFDADAHVYTARGKIVPISVTKLIEQYAIPAEHRFNGRAIIRKNLTSWRSNASNKYHALVTEATDEEAITNVLKHWQANAAAGTAMHALFEDTLNGKEPSAEGREAEMDQFRAAMDSLGDSMTPARTELSVFVTNAEGDPVVAGQIDLLLKDKEGGYHLVDFKRTAADLTPNAWHFGKRFLDGKSLNDHHKYSLQLSLYRLMFEAQTGLKIADDPRILQIHPDLDGHQWTTATDLTNEARALLRGQGMAMPV